MPQLNFFVFDLYGTKVIMEDPANDKVIINWHFYEIRNIFDNMTSSEDIHGAVCH